MVPDSKKMDVPFVVAGTAKWERDLEYERFCPHGDKEGVLHLLLDKVAKNVGDSTTSVTETEPSVQWSRGEGFLHSARSCSHILGSHQR